MKRLWGYLLIAMVVASCGTRINIEIAAINSGDMTLTAVFTPYPPPARTQSPHPTPDPQACTAYNTVGLNVYLRNFPGAQSDLIATWLPDKPLEVLGRNDTGWYLLRIPPNGRAWADEQAAQLVGMCADLPALNGANLRLADYKLPCRISSATGDVVSLYNLPSSDSQIVGELPQAYLMEAVQRTAGGWYYVRDFLDRLPAGWDQGWIYESSLHRNGSCDLTATASSLQGAIISSSGDSFTIGCAALNTQAERIGIYANADANSPLLSWMYPGEKTRLTLHNPDGWFMVEYDAFRGWVAASAAEMTGDCAGLPAAP